MKCIEPRAMREIHDIRLALYEEKKKLSTEEKVRQTNRRARKLLKDYNLGLELRARPRENVGVLK